MNSSRSALMEAYFFFLEVSQEGFDWDSPLEAAAKVKEELEEVIEELHKPKTPLQDQALKEEIGDLFLACSCLADDAIALGLKKFKKRYMRFKSYAKEKGVSLHETSGAELDALWQLAKQDTA